MDSSHLFPGCLIFPPGKFQIRKPNTDTSEGLNSGNIQNIPAGSGTKDKLRQLAPLLPEKGDCSKG